jgi:hypothetical protein
MKHGVGPAIKILDAFPTRRKPHHEVVKLPGSEADWRNFWLFLVSLEHELPERLDFFNMAALTVHRHSGQEESFCEFAFQAELLREWAGFLVPVVIAQP